MSLIINNNPKNWKDRLRWLRELLTRPDIDETINHYQRTLLSEEAEELELIDKENKNAV